MNPTLHRWGARLPPRWRARLQRVAKLGFWFFFIKGMLWLLVPVVLALWATEAATQDAPPAAIAVQSLGANEGEAEVERRERAVRLEQVVVTGTRTAHTLSDSPVEVQLITAAQIKDSGARDVAELLEREGGVTVTRVAGRGTSIEIQGLSSDQVLILIDGRRVVGRINGAIDLTRLKAANIERVEIVKGPSSALYGSDALGGVVNVITKSGGSGSTVTARADSGRNMEAFGGVAYERARSGGNVTLGGTLTDSYDLDKSTPSTDGITGNTRFAALSHTQRFSPGASVRGTLDYSLDDTSRVDAGSAVFDIVKRIEELRLGLAPEFTLGADTSLVLDGYYTRYYDQFLQDQRGADANDRVEKTVDQLYVTGAQLNHRLGRHALSVGLEAQFETLTADRLATDGERDRQSVFLQDELRLLADDALTLVPGVRYDRDSQFGDALSPKLALRYNFSPELFVRVGAGQGYRAPDFKQLLLRFDNPAVGYRVEGNPDLKPERSTGFNVGATWYANAGLSLSGTVFHNRVKNLIDIVQLTPGRPTPGDPVIFGYVNIARARLTGSDVQIEWRPALDARRPLSLRVGHGYLDSEDADTGQPLSGRARHRANADIGWRQAEYELGLRGVWIGKRIFQTELDTGGAPTGAGTADPYFLFDTRAQWKGWRVFDVSVGVQNLFDEGEPRFLPIQPRSVFFELSKDFP
ncbi:MAG: TonB-dependent receptor [Stagnimonas sp.]|nr:TonB-dependent receptor [Stagnimonas sp.]